MNRISLVLAASVLGSPLHAEDDSDLAQQLTNPLADLISMPVQGNINSESTYNWNNSQ